MSAIRRQIPEKLRQALELHRLGQLTRARAAYREILDVEPRHFDALHLSGVIALQMNEPTVALELIGRAIGINPGGAAAHCNRGSALEALGRLEAALASFEHAVSIDPKHVEAQFNRANVLDKLGRLEPALAAYDRAIELKPSLAVAHFNRGKVLRRLRRWHEAQDSFDRAVTFHPDHAEAYLSRGLVQKEMGLLEAALENYDRAIALKPSFVEAHSNRGNVLKKLERGEAALASYERAITIQPDFAEGHFNRGVVLQELGRFDEAVSSYSGAIAVRPDYAEAYSNRGNALTELNRLDEALASYEQAVAISPDSAPAHFNWAIALLVAGDLGQGFREYEWRWRNEAGSVINERREFAQPLWLGEESLAGKAILLYGEQGLGDTIQFCRYAKLVAGMDATVILEVKEPLGKLLTGLCGVSQLVIKGSELPEHDFQCPLMSLPLALKTTLDDVPSPGKYLSSDLTKVDRWRARLGERIKPRIGLAWSGNERHRRDNQRSIPLATLMGALPRQFQYVCLQTEMRDTDRQALASRPDVLNFPDERDFADTAALCDCMDVVISVDTSVAHLSAALGKSTWILLPFNPDWRWMLERTDSPWYAAVTLYRQRRHGDWTGALEQLGRDLIEFFNSWSPPP
jgi:tetratricopeptide (TPR) repeat protein